VNEEMLRQLLVAALMAKHGPVQGVFPPPTFDPSLAPSTEAQRAAIRALQKK
jgi:hypothetical protein